MKKILIFIFLLNHLVTYSQVYKEPKEIKDTTYIVKNNNIYTLINDVYFNDGNIYTTKEILGDSASASWYLLNQSENKSNIVADIIFPEVNQKKIKNDMQEYIRLYNSFNNRNMFAVTSLRDSAEYIGDWRLIFEGEKILGIIQLNNNQRLIFNPDNGKVYTISTNLLLATFTNQISFTFNSVKYDLYKYADGKFATVDGNVRLIKLE
jgi:hypothetical protein